MATHNSSDASIGGEGTAPTQPSLTAPPGITVVKAVALPPPHAAAGAPRPAPPCRWARWRPVLYKAALLLAGAALLADQAFLKHEGPYNTNSMYYRDTRSGKQIARAPGLVTAMSAFAMLLAMALLAWPESNDEPAATAPLPAARSTAWDEDGIPPFVPCPQLLAAAAEAVLMAGMLALWIGALVMAAMTADDLNGYTKAGSWWRWCNAGVLALVCGNVVVWGGILACSLRALVRVLAPGCGGCGAAAEYELLLTDEEASAGSPASWKVKSSADPCYAIPSQDGTCQPPPLPPLQPVRLALHAAAACLALGVVVAQGVLMGHVAYHEDGNDYNYTSGKRVAADPVFVIVTAVVTTTLAGALCTLHCLPRTRWVWAAAVTEAPPLAVCGPAVELLLSCALLGQWAICVSSSAKTAGMPQLVWSAVWRDSNRAMLVLGCCCVLIWLATAAAAAWELVTEARAWWRQRPADAEDSGTDKLRDVWKLLLAAACLLAVGTLVAQGIFMPWHYDRLNWVKPVGKDSPAMILITAAVTVVFSGMVLRVGLPYSIPSAVFLAASQVFVTILPLWLWTWSLWISAATADVLRRTDGVGKWAGCNAVVLVLECASMLVWGGVCAVSCHRTTGAIRALVLQLIALHKGHRQLGNTEKAANAAKAPAEATAGSQGNTPYFDTSSTAAHPEDTKAEIAVRVAQAGQYLLCLLLAVGVLVAQCILFSHTEELDNTRAFTRSDWDAVLSDTNATSATVATAAKPWTIVKQGKQVATAPVLVIATAAITIGAAAVWLLTAGATVIWPGLRARVKASPFAPMCIDVVVAQGGGLVLCLWAVALVVSFDTADTLTDEPYRQSKVWRHCNTAVLVMEAIIFMVWNGAVALAKGRLDEALKALDPVPAQQEAAADANAAAADDEEEDDEEDGVVEGQAGAAEREALAAPGTGAR